MKKSIFTTGILAILLSLGSCTSDENETTDYESAEQQNTEVSITDAPIDDTSVSATIVTITAVKVDGVEIDGFSATTVDLLQLQNGKKLSLGDIDLNVGTVSNISLVLDYDQDVNGDAPGCYVETIDGVKHELKTTTYEIKINDEVEIVSSTLNEIVIDFDLRKTIIASTESSTDEFDFVTSSELSSGLRIVNNIDAGSVSGTVSDWEDNAEKVVVFAYEKGTYTSSEAEESGASGVTFANAVTSATINSTTGSYEVNFLKEGDYEFYFASYSDEDNDGSFEFESMLSVESLTDIQLSSISISSSINLNINVRVTEN